MREDNELIRARGGQLHTIRMLIRSLLRSQLSLGQNSWWVRGTLLLPLPLKFPHSVLQGIVLHEAFPDSSIPMTLPTPGFCPHALLSASPKTSVWILALPYPSW